MSLPSRIASSESPSRRAGNPHILFLEKTRACNNRTIRWSGSHARIAPFLWIPGRGKHWNTRDHLRCPCIQSALLLLSLLPQPALHRYPCETKDQDDSTDTPPIPWILGCSGAERFPHSVWRNSDELCGNPSMQRWHHPFWRTNQSTDWRTGRFFLHPKLWLESRGRYSNSKTTSILDCALREKVILAINDEKYISFSDWLSIKWLKFHSLLFKESSVLYKQRTFHAEIVCNKQAINNTTLQSDG